MVFILQVDHGSIPAQQNIEAERLMCVGGHPKTPHSWLTQVKRVSLGVDIKLYTVPCSELSNACHWVLYRHCAHHIIVPIITMTLIINHKYFPLICFIFVQKTSVYISVNNFT